MKRYEPITHQAVAGVLKRAGFEAAKRNPETLRRFDFYVSSGYRVSGGRAAYMATVTVKFVNVDGVHITKVHDQLNQYQAALEAAGYQVECFDSALHVARVTESSETFGEHWNATLPPFAQRKES